MAYNPQVYNPYGQQQPYSWSQPIWTSGPQNTAQPVNGLVSVTGLEGAKAFQLPPNSSMALFDANEDILYVKTTDGAGFPTIKQYRFEAIESAPVAAPTDAFVPRSEFEALARRVDQLQNRPHQRKKEQSYAKQPIPQSE